MSTSWKHNPRVARMLDDAGEHAEQASDWLLLALAALDQAGLSVEAQNRIEALAWQALPEPRADIALTQEGRLVTR